MFNVLLNLLSPSKKNKVLKLAKFLFIKENLELILLTAALLGIIFLGGWLILVDVLNDLARGTATVNARFAALNQNNRMLNAEIREFNLTSERFRPLVPLLLQITATLPPAVRLSALAYDRTAARLVLSGTAATREELLQYQTILKNLPAVTSVVMPTSQLLQQNNIDFETTIFLTNASSTTP
ncbi:MAG: hypothetical protein HYV42_00300 [Candidatus Magasanikbacteria bacterium]|nr:hypothetical protein [Candidatus Magasanikbacteria bacterium]